MPRFFCTALLLISSPAWAQTHAQAQAQAEADAAVIVAARDCLGWLNYQAPASGKLAEDKARVKVEWGKSGLAEYFYEFRPLQISGPDQPATDGFILFNTDHAYFVPWQGELHKRT